MLALCKHASKKSAIHTRRDFRVDSHLVNIFYGY